MGQVTATFKICSFPFLDDGVGIDPQCHRKEQCTRGFYKPSFELFVGKLYLVKSASSDGAHGYVGKICGLS